MQCAGRVSSCYPLNLGMAWIRIIGKEFRCCRRDRPGESESRRKPAPSLLTLSVSKTIRSPLISCLAQRSFQLHVKTAAYLRHSRIAKLAKERRRLVIFENAVASLIFEQDHSERRVKSGSEFMTGHL